MIALPLPSRPVTDAHVAELADALRTVPLWGPKDAVTAEVRAWAEANGVEGPDAEILAAHNATAETAAEAAVEALRGPAADPSGREALIRLTSFAGTSDAVRRAVIEALVPLAADEVEAFARANMRQRAQVIEAAIDATASAGTAEALFALEKAFATDRGQAAALAHRRALGLWETVREASAIRRILAGHRAQDEVVGGNPRELLYAALALDSPDQRELAGAGALLASVEPEAEHLAARLRELAAGSASLAPYHVRLRDELFEFLLLTGLVSGDLRKRALDNLFRREDLDDVRAVGLHLPDEEFVEYASRALTGANRRGNPARARMALRLARERGGAPPLREAIRASLRDPDVGVRFEAARSLLHAEPAPDPNERKAIAEVFASLPADLQRELAPELRGLSPDQAPSLDLAGLLRWVEGAETDQILPRLETLLDHWNARPSLGSDEVAQVLVVIAGLRGQLEPGERQRFDEHLAKVEAAWLRARGTRLADATRALLGWQGSVSLLVEHFETLAEGLRAEQARSLLGAALDSDPHPGHLAKLASVDSGVEDHERVLGPVLAAAAASHTDALEAAFESADETGQSRLLVATLAAIKDARETAARSAEAVQRGSTEALTRFRGTLLTELDSVSSAAEGNARLSELLDEVRTVLAGLEGDVTIEATGGPPSPAEAPSAAVAEWRREATTRYGDVLEPTGDRSQNLTLRADVNGHEEQLAALVSELDRRAHSTRVAPPADRAHYLADLEAVLAGAIERGVIRIEADELQTAGRGNELGRVVTDGRAPLRELFWRVWRARNETGGGPALLASALRSAAAEPASPSSISGLEAALDGAHARDELRDAVGVLAPPKRGGAFTTAVALLRLDLRAADEARAKERDRELAVGRRIAAELDLPFRVIENLMFSYFRFREAIGRAGWRPVEERLGRTVSRDRIDPERHEILDDDGTAEAFAVRSLGIRYKGTTLQKATLEAVRDGAGLSPQADE